MSTRHSNLDAQQLGQCFNCDIAIIGGGPVGAALALALRSSGLNIHVLEARTANTASDDARGLALSYGSRLLLRRLGVWDELPQVSAIRNIHISQKNSFGRALLRAADLRIPALGYVLPYHALQAALQTALRASAITCLDGAAVTRLRPDAQHAHIHYRHAGTEHSLSARLVVVADGGKLLQAEHPAQEHDYGQSAVISHVGCSQPLPDTAFERFTAHGPVALLPYRSGYETVWTATHAAAQKMMQWDDATFLEQLQQHFGDRVGAFSGISKRTTFALRLRRAPAITLAHIALVGNAAQTLHPVAGQGFNLGLRDAWELAQEILSCTPATLGGEEMLQRYRKARMLDREAGIHFTDGLVRMFSNELPLLSAGRAASLTLLDCLPTVKRFVARRRLFGAHG